MQSRNGLPTTEGAGFAETCVCKVLMDEEQGVGSRVDRVGDALFHTKPCTVRHCLITLCQGVARLCDEAARFEARCAHATTTQLVHPALQLSVSG